MQKYQSHKIVEAAQINGVASYHEGSKLPKELFVTSDTDVHEISEADSKRFDDMSKDYPGGIIGGYLVKYADGYVSWSPAKTFEEGYSVVQPSSGKSNIKGYRELSEEEIANMNAVKEWGAKMGELIDQMRQNEDHDPRWIAIGQTDLQKGLMALTRAIAKPTFF